MEMLTKNLLSINPPTNNSYLLCPDSNCLNIPEILPYSPFDREIFYNCNHHLINKTKNGKMEINNFVKNSNRDLRCSFCLKIIDQNEENYFFYCLDCKKLICNICMINHSSIYKHIKIKRVNHNQLFNYCLEHDNKYIMHCMDCNLSLCKNCDFSSHDEKGHKLIQIRSLRETNQNFINNNNQTILSRKKILKKMTDCYKIIINSFNNEIFIKEKIIESYKDNISNYQSIHNFNTLNIKNDKYYENLLENQLNDINIENLSDEKNKLSFFNILLSPLLYFIMINSNQSLNESLINIYNNLLSIIKNEHINTDNNKNNKKIDHNDNIDNNQKENNENNKDNKDNNIRDDDNNISIIKNNNENKNIYNFNDNNIITDRGENNNNINKQKEKIFYIEKVKNKYLKSYDISNSDYDISISNNSIKNSTSPLKTEEETSINKIINEYKKPENKTVIDKNNVSISNYELISKNQIEHKEIKKIKKEKSILCMIKLKSGNIATCSKNGTVEIYNFQNISSHNSKNNKNKYSLLQSIFLQNKKLVSYILELNDNTLLCSSYGKIFHIKLTKNDTEYEKIEIIQLINSELPTKIIELSPKFIVILSDRKKACHIRSFIKINSNEENKINIINSQKKENFYSLNKEYKIYGNEINKKNKLFVSIFEIKKINKKEYEYEFIATSNRVFNCGDDRIEFFGVKKNNDNNYLFERIDFITNISCSTEANSICQLNDNYICVGLKNFDLNKQISGYAIIDIEKRKINRIIKDHEVMSINMSNDNKFMISSLEVRNSENNFNLIKIYEPIENKNDRGIPQIELEERGQFIIQHDEIISSIIDITQGENLYKIKGGNKINNMNKLFLVTSGYDSKIIISECNID